MKFYEFYKRIIQSSPGQTRPSGRNFGQVVGLVVFWKVTPEASCKKGWFPVLRHKIPCNHFTLSLIHTRDTRILHSQHPNSFVKPAEPKTEHGFCDTNSIFLRPALPLGPLSSLIPCKHQGMPVSTVCWGGKSLHSRRCYCWGAEKKWHPLKSCFSSHTCSMQLNLALLRWKDTQQSGWGVLRLKGKVSFGWRATGRQLDER